MRYQKIMEQYASKAKSMSLEKVLHHITEMYMEQCGISVSLRTVIYEAGEILFEQFLQNPEWKKRIGDDDYLFMAMPYFHEEYTLEMYGDYDIGSVWGKDWEECCEMVIEEQCSHIDVENQVATPYAEHECEQKLQAFCRGASLLLEKFSSTDLWQGRI